MPLEKKLKQRLKEALGTADPQGMAGPRLYEDGERVWRRCTRFIEMELVAAEVDREALELACLAMQLAPRRAAAARAAGRAVRASFKDRAEEAAELLGAILADADQALLDRAARILHEMPHRSPMLDEARLLADATNLDDFGITGLLQQAIAAANQGEGIAQIADGMEKREQYGYWEARLKDGFHFEPVRRIARLRLDNARHVAALLAAELWKDQE